MNACQEMEGLLAERASGEVAAEEAERLDAHLAECERCRGELRAYQETFQLARPAVEPHVGQLDVSTFSAYQRRRRRRVTSLTLGAGFVAAAVAAGVVLAPALLTLGTVSRRPVHVASGDLTLQSPAGLAGQSAMSQTAVAVADASDEVAPEDAALAAFDEIDTL